MVEQNYMHTWTQGTHSSMWTRHTYKLEN